MAKWFILVLVIQNLAADENLQQNDNLIVVGKSMAKPDEQHETPNADFLRDAVKILQIEVFADLRQTIKDLAQENDEKERQIEQIRKDKLDEMKSIKEDFERKLEQKSKEENILEKKLNDQTNLVKYLMIVICKSHQVYNVKKDLIESYAQDVNELKTKLEECQQSNNANLKIVFESQQTIFKQKESMGRLEKVIELEKNVSKSNQDNSESKCNTAPWIESLTRAYNEQQEEIHELTLFAKEKDKIEEHLNNIQESLLNVNQTDVVEECKVLPKYQKLVLTQSESISMLGKLASYATNSTSSLHYEDDENGNLVSALECSCLPEPLNNAKFKPTSIEYECENGVNKFQLNCVDGKCLNKYWPKCVQDIKEKDAPTDTTEEDVFEWSPWSMTEKSVFRKRSSKKISNIYQKDTHTGMFLHTHDGYSYYKVPVAYGTQLVEGSVAKTCKENGMMAVCYGSSGHPHNSAECRESSLQASSLNSISRLICNGNNAAKCPVLEGIFADMKNWHGSDCGNVKGVYYVVGKSYVSQPEHPYFAFCLL